MVFNIYTILDKHIVKEIVMCFNNIKNITSRLLMH